MILVTSPWTTPSLWRICGRERQMPCFKPNEILSTVHMFIHSTHSTHNTHNTHNILIHNASPYRAYNSPLQFFPPRPFLPVLSSPSFPYPTMERR